MWKNFKLRSVELAILVGVLTGLMIEPVWATAPPPPPLPGPAVGGVIAGAAIIGALVIAKWWRNK